jgi:hypothetical protein
MLESFALMITDGLLNLSMKKEQIVKFQPTVISCYNYFSVLFSTFLFFIMVVLGGGTLEY